MTSVGRTFQSAAFVVAIDLCELVLGFDNQVKKEDKSVRATRSERPSPMLQRQAPSATAMQALYDMRSKVEHMHDYVWPDDLPERDRRLLVMRRAAMVQELARQCISRFLVTEDVWPHYAARDRLEAFWALPPDDRQKLWGQPFDLDAIDKKFDPIEFTDEELGLR